MQKIFNLAIIKKEKIQRGRIDDDFVHKTIRGKVDDILLQKSPIQLKGLFSSISEERKVILIDGAPGSGKSTLTVHICQQWGRGKLFNEFTVIILVQLRDPKVQCAQSIAELLPAEDDTMAEQAAREIIACEGSSVLWILDGYDELPSHLQSDSIISTLIKPKLHRKYPLSKTAVVVTSRPISSGDLCPVVSSRIEVLGFTAEEQRLFFTECLNNDIKAVETLMERLSSNPAMEGSCYLPLNASIVAHLYLTNGSLPSTIYGIFSSLIQHYLSRYLHERQGVSLKLASFESLDGLPQELQAPFERLCKLAFMGARDNKVTFSTSDLEALGTSDDICELGLLQAVPTIVSYGRAVYYNFIHLSIQEMLAAVHISKMPANKQISTFNSMLNDDNFSAVLQFYAAITKLCTSRPLLSLVPKFLRRDPASIYDLVGRIIQKASKPLLVSLFNCLYEAQNILLCEYVGMKLKNKLKLMDKTSSITIDNCFELDLTWQSLLPRDCLSIGYFLASIAVRCKENLTASLTLCSLGDTGTKILMQSLCRNLDPCNKVTASLNFHLWFNDIGNEGAFYIAEALRSTRVLRKLSLCGNHIGDKGLQYIAEALTINSSLTELCLSGCSLRITEENGPTLTEMLQRNKTLRELDLTRDSSFSYGGLIVSDHEAMFLTKGLRENTTLKQLYLSECNIADGVIQLLENNTSTCEIIKSDDRTISTFLIN